MRILLAAVISEGLLLGLAVALAYIADLTIVWNWSLSAIAMGLALTLPPLAINHVLWGYSERNPDSIYGRFSREIIVPLCQHMRVALAATVALLSGICEELFFRGSLNYLCISYLGNVGACITTSVLFAAMHFIGNFKRYGEMLPLYTVMGGYLWFAHFYTGSLAAVAILHAVYNFIVITTVRIRTTRT
jgi:membrane protease YdiL (CAAX protease family)